MLEQTPGRVMNAVKIKGDFSAEEKSPSFFRNLLNDCHVNSGRAFFALFNGECHAIAFMQRTKTLGIDA